MPAPAPLMGALPLMSLMAAASLCCSVENLLLIIGLVEDVEDGATLFFEGKPCICDNEANMAMRSGYMWATRLLRGS
jgi:hypothetical protein